MKIKELKQQRLEERQLAKGGLAIAVLGTILTFAGSYVSRGMEVGYSQANQEVGQVVSQIYNDARRMPQVRMQF